MAKEHLRFAAIAVSMGDDIKRQRHLDLALVAQAKCDSGRCECAQKCEPLPGPPTWASGIKVKP